MKILLLLLLLLSPVTANSSISNAISSSSSSNNINSVIENTNGMYGLSFPEDYNTKVRPPGKSQVRVAFEIGDVSEVSDDNFSITLVMSTSLMWNDSRITISEEVFKQLNANLSWYALSEKEYSTIWTPSLRFLHLKHQRPLVEEDSTSPANTRTVYLTNHLDFRLYESRLTSTTVSCGMDFTSFPFDDHTCYFELTALLPIEYIELVYLEEAGWGRADITTTLEYRADFSDLPKDRHMRLHYYLDGHPVNVSYAGFTLKLKRKATPYLLNYYLPSSLLVAVSWASFAIPPLTAIPGRVALLITTFLSLANIINSAFAYSPLNQGINLMQTYIISCIGFVFVAVIEYFYILSHDRFFSKNKNNSKFFKHYPKILQQFTSPNKIDKHFLILCPLMYLIFSTFYWMYVKF